MSKFDKVSFMIPVEEIESSALDQIKAVTSHDFVKKMAIMPDCHTGYDMPIGGVALTKGVVVPGWVGYDISCGVLHYPFYIHKDDFLKEVDLQKLFQALHRDIPTGTSRFGREPGEFKSALGDKDLDKEVQANQYAQLGTLGSGNHFLEIGYSVNTSMVGVTIHSGSRNLGHRICTHYMKRGKYFGMESELGRAYLEDMRFAGRWARQNRRIMLSTVLRVLANDFGVWVRMVPASIVESEHNFAEEMENEDVLHRKGATPAYAGEMGIIPGNMRDGVFIVRGLGNKHYLNSCAHGAGRVMGRKEAKRTLSVQDFEETMQDVVAGVGEGSLDESPMAYKDIFKVIGAQTDQGVLELVDYFKPLVNIKG